MDEGTLKERVKRLQEINKVIAKLDPGIRGEAFSLLRDYVTGPPGPGKDARRHGGVVEHETDDDRGAFFSNFDHDKPADNVNLLAAYHYKEYGCEAFFLGELRGMAGDVGLTIPGRIDMTLVQAKREGKKLYTRSGTGKFKPTVHGESYLKKTYSVSKGRKKKPAEAGE